MSYQFGLEGDAVLRFYMHGNVSAINHNYRDRLPMRAAPRNIIAREFIERDITSAGGTLARM